MNGWFLAVIALYLLSLGIHLAKHGEPRDDKYNFWSTLVGGLIQITLIYFAIKSGF
ncbi:hypothetical protein [Paraliobacillus ryukyuensis]|uniref:hypothetical protein n=1 Tax=Paraliobacillus ryukyuensis TaxID=200904 RepID=UPI0015C495DE|nr:hypothetical protein [Paraliobacillus ryukyuensis]